MPGDFLGERPRNRSDQVVDYGECGLLPKRKQASRMVHSQNMHLLLDQTIDNAIRALNDFTDLWIGKFRHNPPRLRKQDQAVHYSHESLRHQLSGMR